VVQVVQAAVVVQKMALPEQGVLAQVVKEIMGPLDWEMVLAAVVVVLEVLLVVERPVLVRHLLYLEHQ
jgi:hypothetical protein